MNRVKIILILIMIILGVTGLILSKNKNMENYEIAQKNLETKIVLYFSDLETGKLTKEYRYVDINSIKENIAGTIINELLKGPNTEGLVSSVPYGTKVKYIKEEGDKIEIDFSKEYSGSSGDELQNLHKIYSVVNSLTEITEINEVEIKVEGKTITNKVRL